MGSESILFGMMIARMRLLAIQTYARGCIRRLST